MTLAVIGGWYIVVEFVLVAALLWFAFWRGMKK